MRFLAPGVLLIGLAVAASGCCLPLDILNCCLGVANTGLTSAAAADRGKLEVPAPATVTEASLQTQQRF